jgi:hypothetical protein
MRTIGMMLLLALGACHHPAAPVTPPPPPAPTCEAVRAHIDQLVVSSHGAKSAQAIAAAVGDHCTKDAWSESARSCIVNSPALDAGHHCLDQLPTAQHEALMADIIEVAARAQELPMECFVYKKQMQAYFDCDKIPQAARDAAKAGFDAAWQAWSEMPAEAKASLAPACEAAADASRVMVCPE